MKVKKIGDEQNPVDVHIPDTVPQKEIIKNISSDKSNSGNKTLYFIIGGILIVLISVSLYYFLIYQKSENKVAGENNTQSELKKKELELKEKELQLKEKELNQNNTTQKSTDKNEYSITPGRFPEASLRFLTSDELNTISKYDLKIMRNEIFARYGYIFQTEDMRDYFSGQTWYSPRYNDVNSFLTKIEKKNIDLIKYFEK
jgi:hypothetical protein